MGRDGGRKREGKGQGSMERKKKRGEERNRPKNEQKSVKARKNQKNTVKKQCYFDLAISASILVARS